MTDPIRGYMLYEANSQSEAENAYDELLAYVGRLEYDGCYDIESLERLYGRPEWLRSVSE